MHVADFMTLAGNMYLFFLASSKHGKHMRARRLISRFFNVVYETKADLCHRRAKIIIPDVKSICKGYQEFRRNIGSLQSPKEKSASHNWIPFFEIVGEGLFLLAMLFAFALNLKTGEAGSINLERNDIVYMHFQYTGGSDLLLRYIAHLSKEQKLLASLSPFIGKMTPPKHKSKSKHKLPLEGPVPMEIDNMTMTSFRGGNQMFQRMSADIPAPRAPLTPETIRLAYAGLEEWVAFDREFLPRPHSSSPPPPTTMPTPQRCPLPIEVFAGI